MDWESTRLEVLATIAEDGADAILRRPNPAPPVFEPTTGKYIPGVPHDCPCKVLLTNYESKLIDGTLVKIGDRQVLVPAEGLDIVPDPSKDKLILSGVAWNVMPPVVEIGPGGVPILYKLQVRK